MMVRSQLRLLLTCVVVLGVSAGSCFAEKAVGPYPMQMSIDVTDYIVVGAVVGTDDFDPNASRRVSRVLVSESIHGDVAVGDTLSVVWSTGRVVHPDGSVTEVSPVGPQLDRLTGEYLWLIGTRRSGEPRCTYDPIRVGWPSRSVIEQQLEWARRERIPYGGLMSDPARREAKGIDLAAGDSLRAIVAEYLAGVLDAME